jgi:hypothetical protein
MAAELPTVARPAATTQEQTLLEQVLRNTGAFDPEMYHVMDQRDDALIRDEVLNGVSSDAFVYAFNIMGKPVVGVSVKGAAHLAHSYGGIKHKLIASTKKNGPLFVFTQYPGEGHQMAVQAQRIPELEDEDDYYEVVVEVSDIKNGNTVQITKKETKHGKGQNGIYERPHYETLAESKAFRNAVLRLLPQDVVEKFKANALAKGKSADVTEDTIDEKRAGILQFAAAKGVAISRKQVEALTLAQISGLREAARQGIDQFKASAAALGLIAGDGAAPASQPDPSSIGSATSPPPPPASSPAADPSPRKGGRRGGGAAAATQGDQRPEPPAADPPTAGPREQAVDRAAASPGPGTPAPAPAQAPLLPATDQQQPAGPTKAPPPPKAAPPAEEKEQNFLEGFS